MHEIYRTPKVSVPGADDRVTHALAIAREDRRTLAGLKRAFRSALHATGRAERHRLPDRSPDAAARARDARRTRTRLARASRRANRGGSK